MFFVRVIFVQLDCKNYIITLLKKIASWWKMKRGRREEKKREETPLVLENNLQFRLPAKKEYFCAEKRISSRNKYRRETRVEQR